MIQDANPTEKLETKYTVNDASKGMFRISSKRILIHHHLLKKNCYLIAKSLRISLELV